MTWGQTWPTRGYRGVCGDRPGHRAAAPDSRCSSEGRRSLEGIGFLVAPLELAVCWEYDSLRQGNPIPTEKCPVGLEAGDEVIPGLGGQGGQAVGGAG